MKRVMKLTALILMVILFFAACGKKGNEAKGNGEKLKISAEAAKLVRGVSDGYIFHDGEILVEFYNPQVGADKVGLQLKKKIFFFNPARDGQTYWKNQNTLAFKFNRSLKVKEKISGYISMEALFPGNRKLKGDKIPLKLTVVGTTIKEFESGFENVKQNDPTAFYMGAKVIFSGDIDIKKLKQSIEITESVENGSKRNVNFNVGGKGKNFAIKTEALKRDDFVKRYKIRFKPDILKLNQEYTYEETLSKISDFNVQEVKYSDQKDERFLSVIFSDSVNQNFDYKPFIRIEPAVNFTVKTAGKMLILSGNFEYGKTYKGKVLKGVKSKWLDEMKSDYNFTIKYPDLKPAIEFYSNGIILSSENDGKIAFKAVNVNAVTVVVKRVFENNLIFFLQENNLSGAKTSTASYYDFSRVGVEEFNKKIALDNMTNKWRLYDLDLNELIKNKKTGLYIIEISFNNEDITAGKEAAQSSEEDEWYDETKITKPVILSDVGLYVKKTGKKMTVFVNDINTTNGVSGAKVVSKTYTNQILEEKSTDGDGNVVLEREGARFIEVYYKDSRAIMDLERNRMDMSTFDVDGTVSDIEGNKAFIYTERGVYRPGDDINLSAVIRSSKGSLPDKHPVTLKFYNPKGRLIKNSVNKDGKDGFYSFKLKTDESAPTGEWKVELTAGASTFIHIVKVETIVPYKIRVNLTPDKTAYTRQDTAITTKIDSQYLFGTPAANLTGTMSYRLIPYDVTFNMFKGYVFTDSNAEFNEITSSEYNIALDSEGKSETTWEIPQVTNVPSGLKLEVSSKIIEKSGRPVPLKRSVEYNYYNYFVGIKQPTEYYLRTGTKVRFDTIVVDKNGQPQAGRSIKYRIYKNNYYWWWDYDSENDLRRHFKKNENTELISSGELVSGEKPVFIEFTPDDYGKILIEAEDEGGHISNFFVTAYSWGDEVQQGNNNTIKIKSDKKSYEVGDKARFICETPKQGKMLVSIEKGNEVLKSYWTNITSAETEIMLDITKAMTPNVYVSIMILQKHADAGDATPQITYGVIPVMVSNSETKLDFDIKAPETVKPNSSFELEIKTKSIGKSQFTVAVVDEGLLNITGYKTPDPWGYFYAKEALQILYYEIYSLVIGKTTEIPGKTIKIGGDESLAYMSKKLQGTKAKRFDPVSIFYGPIETDMRGYVKVKVNIPNYIGSVKVMVIGVKGNAYGKQEKDIPVKSELMVSPELPRVLTPGDKIVMPVTLYATKDGMGEVNVEVSGEGPFKIHNPKQSVNFEKQGEQDLYFTIEVKEAVGKGKIKVTAKSSQYSAIKETEIGIRMPNPYTYKSEIKGVAAGQEVSLKIPGDGVAGTNSAKLTISKIPILKLNSRLKYLVHYPYGCIEQTVSSVFPQLYMKQLFSMDTGNIDVNINGAIERIRKFQTPSGGLSYWPNDGEANEWGTNYALHFLIEAKKRGYFVPDDMFDNIISYQQEKARKATEASIESLYRLYVLALADNAAISPMNYYKINIAKLNNTQRFLLAAAYGQMNEINTAKEILKNAQFKVNKYNEFSGSYGSDLRDKAIILETLVLLNEHGKGIELYKGIVNDMESGYWYSTQTTAYSLLAIAKYLEKTKVKGGNENISGTIYLPDGKKIPFNFAEEKKVYDIVSGFGKNINISWSANQGGFVSVDWEGVPMKGQVETQSNNMALQVDWYDDDMNRVDVTNMKKGSSFWGIITLTSSYGARVDEMSLMQIMPSGWEIENIRLSGEKIPDGIIRIADIGFEEFMDIRDDRIIWFFDMEGTRRFAFKVNVVTEGEYQMPPIVAEAMYNKSYGAVLKGMKVRVNR